MTLPMLRHVFWRAAFKFLYRILALLDPLIRAVWRRVGIGNVVELEVAKRSAPQSSRGRLIGLLSAGGRTYVGHPSGDVGWTRDLAAAGNAVVRYHDGTTWRVVADKLPIDSNERESAVRATGQHPFPGNLIYRLARRHVRATGVFFRLDEAPT